jgi:hypothetical protein
LPAISQGEGASEFVANIAAAAAVDGVVYKLSGGSFENGAVTSAFA